MASSTVDRINDILTCSICLERYKNPKILPCHHSFCEQCLVKWVEQHGGLECPNCRTRHYAQNIRELPPTLLVSDVVEVIENESEKKHGDNICHGCQENPSFNRCVDCDVDLCITCTKAHQKLPFSREHRIITVEEYTTRGNVIHCDVHRDEIADLYCLTCKVAVCRVCTSYFLAGHPPLFHSVYELESTANDIRKAFESRVQFLQEKQNEVQQNIKSALEEFEEVSREQAQRELQIKRHAQSVTDKVINQLRKAERGLLAESKNGTEKMMAKISDEIRQYRTSEELLTSTAICVNNLLLKSSDLQLIKTLKEINTQLETSMSLDIRERRKNESCLLPQFCPDKFTLQGTMGRFRSRTPNKTEFGFGGEHVATRHPQWGFTSYDDDDDGQIPRLTEKARGRRRIRNTRVGGFFERDYSVDSATSENRQNPKIPGKLSDTIEIQPIRSPYLMLLLIGFLAICMVVKIFYSILSCWHELWTIQWFGE
ncbi:transcription intermediary factor 1-beta-like [Saccoglossus kowalevskii]